MLSNKTKYGLHAAIYLAENYEKGAILISELAKKEKLPRKFLEAILLELKKKGVLNSKKGKGGGYFLARPPKSITLGEIIRILEGPLAPVSCVSQTAYKPCDECRDEQHCGIRLVMKDVRDAIANILDKTSLEDIALKIRTLGADKTVNYHI